MDDVSKIILMIFVLENELQIPPKVHSVSQVEFR